MKKSSIILLQTVVVVVGFLVLFFMIWEPNFEGRNVNATLYQVYFNDPFLIYAYTASIAFFTALYQTIKLLGLIGQNKTFSFDTLKALRTIKYCATMLVGFVLAAEAYLVIFNRGKDDIAGGVFIGLLFIAVSGTIATIARMFEHIVENTLNSKQIS